jgi:hypothetical protein
MTEEGLGIADFGLRNAEWEKRDGRRIVSRLLPQPATATLAALPAMSLIPFRSVAECGMRIAEWGMRIRNADCGMANAAPAYARGLRRDEQ